MGGAGGGEWLLEPAALLATYDVAEVMEGKKGKGG